MIGYSQVRHDLSFPLLRCGVTRWRVGTSYRDLINYPNFKYCRLAVLQCKMRLNDLSQPRKKKGRKKKVKANQNGENLDCKDSDDMEFLKLCQDALKDPYLRKQIICVLKLEGLHPESSCQLS